MNATPASDPGRLPADDVALFCRRCGRLGSLCSCAEDLLQQLLEAVRSVDWEDVQSSYQCFTQDRCVTKEEYDACYATADRLSDVAAVLALIDGDDHG